MPTFIGNQPVDFQHSIDDCHINQVDRANLVDSGDQTYAQWQIEPCSDATELVGNGSFSALTGGLPDDWTITGTGFTWDGSTAAFNANNFGLLSQVILDQGSYYRVRLDINSIESGTIRVTLGVNQIAQITNSGSYELFGWCADGMAPALSLTIQFDANTVAVIDNVSCFKVEHRYVLGFKDSTGVQSQIKLEDSITYNPTTNLPVLGGIWQLVDNYMTVKVDWDAQGVGFGVYQFCLLDPCNNTNGQNYLENGEFNAASGWTINDTGLGTGSIGSGLASFVSTGAGSTEFTRTAITSGKTYTVTVKINTISNANVSVDLGTNQTSIWTSSGTFTETIVANGTNVDLNITSIGVGNADVDYVRLEIANSEVECDNTSNSFDYCSEHECTLQLHLCQDEQSFGFDWTGFIPNVRVFARLVNSQYEYPTIIKEFDSVGVERVLFGERKKNKVLKLGSQPERIHDFLSLSVIADHFLIDNVEHNVTDEEWQPNYPETRENIGAIQLIVRQKTQNIVNVNCDGFGEPCFLSPNYMLLSDTNEAVMTFEGGAAILLSDS